MGTNAFDKNVKGNSQAKPAVLATCGEETERPITVSEGTNKVIGTAQKIIISEINNSLGTSISNEVKINYWDGNTSKRIFEVLFK